MTLSFNPQAFDDIVDARSPKEFADSHIPNAINLPALFDDERQQVGTLYKQDAFHARHIGAAMVANNIAKQLTSSLQDKPPHWTPLVYCARGGQRSGALVEILKRVGWRAEQLAGGYKHYRQQLGDYFTHTLPHLPLIVISGRTGVGKTDLLQHLQQQGAAVLDLETLAHHRGSVFGVTTPQPTQKQFENNLYDACLKLPSNQPIFIEAESSRIGKIHLPKPLVERMRNSPFIRLQATLHSRVEFIIANYACHQTDTALFYQALDGLKQYLSPARRDYLAQCHQQGRWHALVETLLTHHYDSRYDKALTAHYDESRCLAVLSHCPFNPAESGKKMVDITAISQKPPAAS